MIRNAYREAVIRLGEERKRIESRKVPLEKIGLSAADVKRAFDPIRSVHLQLHELVENHEQLNRGAFDESGVFTSSANS